MRNFLGFISTRFLRGRARLLIPLLLLVNIIAIVFIPERLSSVVFGNEVGPLLRWRGSARGHGSTGGGLRVVVFGSPDFAMGHERRHSGSSKSWTEYLCEQLRCSSYLSYVPTVDTRTPDPVLVSNSAYNEAFENFLSSQDFDASRPGLNYTYLRDQYPVPAHPDLASQVASFLDNVPPKGPPKETLWVFSFGAWDVWMLSALPRETAEPVIDYMARHLFEQIELLYKSSLVDSSVAFSDFWGYAEPEVIEKLRTASLGKSRSEMEMFRVLIPTTLDVSIMPGWNSHRPQPPKPHSLAVHMTNAAYLTKRWNAAIAAHIVEWEKMPPPYGDGDDEVGDDRAETRKRSLDGRANGIKSDDTGEDPNDPNPLLAPFPRRKALVFDSSNFVLEAIIEQQLRDSNLSDKLGRGSRPPMDPLRFEEVWHPCSEGNVEEGGGKWLKVGGGWRRPCRSPDQYLFQTPFTVNDRATREIARHATEAVKTELYLQDPRDMDTAV